MSNDVMIENPVAIKETKSAETPQAPITTITDLGKRQTLAGTVVGGIRQPELTDLEKKMITADPASSIDDATREALRRQGIAGIGGEPELTVEERQLIVKHNNSLPSRH